MRQPRGIEILDAVTAKALSDETYKMELLADPKAVLRAEGLQIDDDVEIEVLQNTADLIHLVLPSKAPTSIDLDEVDIRIIAYHTGGM